MTTAPELPTTPTVILFDWNGTVVLDADRARHALNDVLTRRDLPTLDPAAFRREFHLPMSEMFDRLDVTDGAAAETEWNNIIAQHPTTAREGIETLRGLQSSGVRLGVVSAAFSHAVHADIDGLGLDGFWDSVDAPATDKLTTLRRRRGAEPQAIYLGDTPYDMGCAIAAGYTPVGVDRGYIPVDELTAAGATAIITTFDELPALLVDPTSHLNQYSPPTKETTMSTALRMWPLDGAIMNADKSVVHFGDSGPIKMPLPTFLIEHEQGLVLIDTGLNPAAWDAAGPGAIYEAHAVFPLECPPGNRVDEQIVKAGFSVDDVSHVIISHTHFDHTGGLYLFPNAEIIIGEAELEYAYNPIPFYAFFFGTVDLDKVPDTAWRKITGDLDLFGDGSIQILLTPGHTPGQLTTLVKLPNRNFIIVGDAAHTHTNMAGIPCPVGLDTNAAYYSIERIKEIAARENADIWVVHDAEQWQEMAYTGTPYN